MPVAPFTPEHPFAGYESISEPIGSADDFGTPEPASGEVLSHNAQGPTALGPAAAMTAFLRKYGLPSISPEDVTVQQALESGMANFGIDTTDPAIQAILEDPELQRMVAASIDPDNPRADEYSNRLTGLYAGLAQQYGATVPTEYDLAVQQYGFEQPGQMTTTTVQPTGDIGIGGSLGGFAKPPKPGQLPKAAAQTSETGAKMFPNGVIVDPNTPGSTGMPAVYFPENDPKVAGSQAWLIRANRTWGPDQVKSQVAELIKFGYLDKQFKNVKTMSIEVMTALKNFHTARYALGNGKPIAQGAAAAGGGTGGLAPEENLRNIRAGLTQEVRNQYQRVFGDDPKPAELKEWTEFVIRAGNTLQKAKGLPTATAASEAVAQVAERMEKLPSAKWDDQIAQEQEENTQMRDGLTTAAAATSGILGWG